MVFAASFLKIKDVLPSLFKDPWAVVIILHIFVAGDDDAWLKRLHFIESGNPLLALLLIGGLGQMQVAPL